MSSPQTIVYVTTPAQVKELAAAIIANSAATVANHATYLCSLLAGVQIELTGKPITRTPRGGGKSQDAKAGLMAFDKVNAVFYEAVLSAVPMGLNPEERASSTAFARSSASTLRRAIQLGWNPLGMDLTKVSKAALRTWINEHRPARAPDVKRVAAVAKRYADKIAGLVEGLEESAAAEIVTAAITALESLGLTEIRTPPARHVQRIKEAIRAHN